MIKGLAAKSMTAIMALCMGTGLSLAAPKEVAIMQGLDKVTARVSTFSAEIDKPVQFGALTITVRHCDRTPPEEPPESAAFMEIWEQKRGDDEPLNLFNGWMFASSPALSALQHAVYDVWVLECVAAPEEGASDSN